MGRILPRDALILLAAAAVGAAAALAAPVPESQFPPPAPTECADEETTLDRRVADFLEDGDSRIVGALEAVVTRRAEGTALTIRASAIGPRIAPPPGVEALSGSNDITAREIGAILADGRAEVRILGPAPSSARGCVLAGRREKILERRLLADGTVEHVPAGGTARVVEAVFDAPLPGEGRFHVEVVVDGRVRARATCVVGGGRGRITSLEGVAGHGTQRGRP